MKRHVISGLVLSTLALLSVAPVPSHAAFPDRPVTMVIPLGAGGSHDLHARGMAPELGKILGQPVIIKLLPGGAGMKGTEFVASGPADGYTILFTHNYIDQLVPQIQKVSFNPLTDFKTVAQINKGIPLFESPASAKFKTLKEFVAYSKANPGKINFGHSGVWGALYVPSLQLVREAGLEVNFIPHKGGGPLLRALLAGQDDIGGVFATQSRPHVKAGKLIVLAVVGNERLKGDPDFGNVPTTAELGFPKVAAVMDRIVMAPAKTPADRLKILRDAFEKLSKSTEFKVYLEKIGEDVQFMGGAEYDQLRPEKYKEFGALIKEMTAK